MLFGEVAALLGTELVRSLAVSPQDEIYELLRDVVVDKGCPWKAIYGADISAATCPGYANGFPDSSTQYSFLRSGPSSWNWNLAAWWLHVSCLTIQVVWRLAMSSWW
jgi:hypothetical protein